MTFSIETLNLLQKADLRPQNTLAHKSPYSIIIYYLFFTMLSIILPTYNEAENIKILIPLLDWYFTGQNFEIIVVDDNSPDGTAQIAESYKNKGIPVRVLVRKKERGLASATEKGIKIAKGDRIAVMDSDLQHDPKYLPKMLERLEKGADMVIGSRYIKNGRVKRFDPFRLFISKLSIFVFLRILTDVKDPLGQFFMVKKEAIKNIQFSKLGMRTSLEILVKGDVNKIVEIPISFANRYAGESKLTLKSASKDLELVKHLYLYKVWKFFSLISLKLKLFVENN